LTYKHSVYVTFLFTYVVPSGGSVAPKLFHLFHVVPLL